MRITYDARADALWIQLREHVEPGDGAEGVDVAPTLWPTLT